ncbi:MAG: DUF4197 domain-containing protein [Cytophagales bacterium]|nr:DUF4197 domain-containing protein [Cytophagales bacterium]
MKKLSVLLISMLSVALLFSSCEELEGLTSEDGALSNEEIVSGLKNALEVGTDTSVSILHAKDGFYKDELVKVIMPDEAKPILDAVDELNDYGVNLQPLIDDVVLSMNRSAEKAADRATPIFKDAITNMSITDALGILYGEDNAATTYLKDNTYNELKSEFSPEIAEVLEEKLIGDNSTESLYGDLVSEYNRGVGLYNAANFLGVLGEDKETISNTSLTDHVATKALDGLFLKVENEEKDIRKDPIARVTDILTKVFSKLDE